MAVYSMKSEITDDRYKKPIQTLSGLFRRVTSNHNGDFHCLGSLHSFRTDVLKRQERLCNNHKYCEIVMPAKDKNITLKYNSGEKSLKVSNIFYLGLESLLMKTQSSQSNPEESYTETKAIHEACGYSLDLLRSYDKNTNSFYRGTDCTKKLCKDLTGILTGKKHRQIKLQRLQKVQIWAFGLIRGSYKRFLTETKFSKK